MRPLLVLLVLAAAAHAGPLPVSITLPGTPTDVIEETFGHMSIKGADEADLVVEGHHWTAKLDLSSIKNDDEARKRWKLVTDALKKRRTDAAPALEAILKLLTDYKDLKLELGGHTDNVGERSYNQTLSENRVAAVKAWLVKNGVVGDRLTTHGYADTVPLVGTIRPRTKRRTAASSSRRPIARNSQKLFEASFASQPAPVRSAE